MSGEHALEAKELLAIMARALVDRPDEVEVVEEDEDGETVLEIRVAQGDIGKIVGKEGRTVRALRTIMDAAGRKHGRTLAVEVLE